MSNTTPTPAPAPMTAERLEEIRKRVGPNAICAYAAGDCFVDELLQEVTKLRWIKASYERDIEQRAKWASEQSAHIDALTARVAELERERDRLFVAAWENDTQLVGAYDSAFQNAEAALQDWRDERDKRAATEARAQAAEAKLEIAHRTLRMWQSYGCPVCLGDCAAANPPVIECPMQETERALQTKDTTP